MNLSFDRVRTRRVAVAACLVVAAVLLFFTFTRVASNPSQHSQIDRFWLGLTGASETRQMVTEAHQRYNELVWTAADAGARERACRHMRSAVDTARQEYDDQMLIAEVGAVADAVCDHHDLHPHERGSYTLDRHVHDVLAGHESWLQVNG